MELTPNDISIFETIQRHGILPRFLIHPFVPELGKWGLLRRLQVLTKHGYLEHMDEVSDPNSFTYYKVYNLTEKALKKLGSKRNEFAPAIREGTKHGLMTAYITANIELECIKAGYRFVSQEEILRDAPKKDQKLRLPSHIVHPDDPRIKSDRPTEPDQLFGIDYEPDYPMKNCRIFALETDCGTEPQTRKDLDDRSLLRKHLCYQDINKHKRYLEYYGVSHLYMMLVTTNQTRVTNAIREQKKIYPNGTKFFLYNSMEGFDPYFKPPTIFYPHLFGTYRRSVEPLDISKP